jgi:hypothetical protein
MSISPTSTIGKSRGKQSERTHQKKANGSHFLFPKHVKRNKIMSHFLVIKHPRTLINLAKDVKKEITLMVKGRSRN